MAWKAHAQVTCTAAGRFADPADTTCQNYTLCVYVSTNASFISYNYVCPSTSVFNPNSAQCTSSISYTCNVTTANTTTTSVCTADGYIADPSSSNCSAYIECVDLYGNGTYSETTLDCPSGTYFDPNTTFCESTYACSSSFTCSTAGRFANTADTTCQSYYYCVLTSTETFVQYNYTCPTTSVFSPTAALCTTSYTCPS